MKRLSLIIIPLLSALSFLNGQAQHPFNGDWIGKLDVGVLLPIVFHIHQAGNDQLISTMDSPDQKAFGLRSDTSFIQGDSIIIKLNAIGVRFAGKLENDSVMKGKFFQGREFPLEMKKTTIVIKEKVRSQTPIPPFPYSSEDLFFDNLDKSIHYGSTLTIPEGTGPFPAVVLITGSGPQNRDEDIAGHKIFMVLADALTRNGIVVLRVDDRGVGKTTGKFNGATSADFANDVAAALDYLVTRKEVDKKKLGLIGHSEGGMIAPMVVTRRKDVAFTILLAGPGTKIDQLMVDQNRAILSSAGVPKKAIDSYIPLYKKLISAIPSAPDTSVAGPNARKLIEDWISSADTSIIRSMGLDSEIQRYEMSNSMVLALSSIWFKYFLAFDPAPYLEKMTGKVLALNGSRDIQVAAVPNLAGIEAGLKKSKVKNYTVKQLPGLNHLFQTCNDCTVQEYEKLDETFSPMALKEINDWLNKNVK